MSGDSNTSILERAKALYYHGKEEPVYWGDLSREEQDKYIKLAGKGEPLFDVVAQNIKTGEKRFLDKGKTEKNADAIVKFAVIRRGVDEEFYYTAPANSIEADSKDYDHANQ